MESARVRASVTQARRAQWERLLEELGCFSNAQLEGELLDSHCELESAARSLLKRSVVRFGLSARAHVRIVRVARTVADLQGAEKLSAEHVAEAVQYRAAGELIGG